MRTALLFVLAVMILGGCGGVLNEGATRVSMAPAEKPSPQGPYSFKQIFFPPDTRRKLNIIKPDDFFSVSLINAYVQGFTEISLLDRTQKFRDTSNPAPEGWTGRRSSRITRGEIALLVNAGEITPTSTTVSPSFRSQGRVVYYNDDVRKSGQLLNILNIPVYGPTKYTGSNFFFSLTLMELDNEENAKIKTLLQPLAAIGSAVLPTHQTTISVLNTLGGALLRDNTDDVEAHFQMRFDLNTTNATSWVDRIPLAEGYYAFVREETRENTPRWTNLQVNRAYGELCTPDTSTYRGGTWFLFRVAREPSDVRAQYGSEVATFMNALEQSDITDLNATLTRLEELKARLTELQTSHPSRK